MTFQERLALAQEPPAWMYEIDLGDGIKTPLLSDELRSIHQTREQMLVELISRHYPNGLANHSCLDVGCNEGYFSHVLYHRGARVCGLDIRAENIRRARLVQQIKGLDPARLEFKEANLFDYVFPAEGYEITLALGLLYHLEDPMGALRKLRALTRGCCIVESQLTRQTQPITSGWGQSGPLLELPASIAILREELHAIDRLASHGGRLSFIPNRAALILMMETAGFTNIVQLPARTGMNPQYLAQDRLMLAGFVKGN